MGEPVRNAFSKVSPKASPMPSLQSPIRASFDPLPHYQSVKVGNRRATTQIADMLMRPDNTTLEGTA